MAFINSHTHLHQLMNVFEGYMVLALKITSETRWHHEGNKMREALFSQCFCCHLFNIWFILNIDSLKSRNMHGLHYKTRFHSLIAINNCKQEVHHYRSFIPSWESSSSNRARKKTWVKRLSSMKCCNSYKFHQKKLLMDPVFELTP